MFEKKGGRWQEATFSIWYEGNFAQQNYICVYKKLFKYNIYIYERFLRLYMRACHAMDTSWDKTYCLLQMKKKYRQYSNMQPFIVVGIYVAVKQV